MSDEIQALIDLIEVPGPSCREKAISDKIRLALLDLGVSEGSLRQDEAHLRSRYGGEVGNLIVDLPGHGNAPRRLLSTHLDTIPSAVGTRPYAEGNRLLNRARGHSLGADARAGCAALIHAVRALVRLRGDHPPCTFVFFVQEELGLVGSRGLDTRLLGEPAPAMAFNFDGENVRDIVTSVIGVERLYISVHGVAAHGSRPRAGISAAEIEARALAALAEAGWHGLVDRREGSGTSNLGVLNGGTMSNQVMPELSALMEARSFDREFRRRIIEEWKKEFRRAVSRQNGARRLEKKARVSFSPGPVYEPFALDEGDLVVVAAKRALASCGLIPVLIADPGGMDANNLVDAGIPCVGIGMGMYNPHQEDEWLDLRQFHKSCRLAVRLSTDTGSETA